MWLEGSISDCLHLLSMVFCLSVFLGKIFIGNVSRNRGGRRLELKYVLYCKLYYLLLNHFQALKTLLMIIIIHSLQCCGCNSHPLLTLCVHAQRGLQYLVCVCLSVCLSVSSNLASRATTRNTKGFSVVWTVN